MLAKSPGGNMDQVYRAWVDQTEHTIQCAEDAERAMRRLDARKPVMENEISEGATADWYLVQTFAGDDLRAMRWLARRRFGVFRPMQQRTEPKSEGQPIGMMEPVFPGHLFVYVWGIEKMRSRVLACPGVMNILCSAEGRPIPVNQRDKQGELFIDKLRALSWVYEEGLTRVGRQSERHQHKPRPTKLGRKERRAIVKLKQTLKLTGRFDPSTWAKAAELAPAKRIALLMQALNGPAAEGGALRSA